MLILNTEYIIYHYVSYNNVQNNDKIMTYMCAFTSICSVAVHVCLGI